MAIVINLILIAVVIVCITDKAQFFIGFEEWLSKKLGGKVQYKILECSLCQTWWASLCYLIATHSVYIWTIALALLIAISTSLIGDIIQLSQDMIGFLINAIYKLIEK